MFDAVTMKTSTTKFAAPVEVIDYHLGNSHILHVIAGQDEFKAKQTPLGWWVYWAESYTWATSIPKWVRQGWMYDVPCGPGTYGEIATYLGQWADQYKE